MTARTAEKPPRRAKRRRTEEKYLAGLPLPGRTWEGNFPTHRERKEASGNDVQGRKEKEMSARQKKSNNHTRGERKSSRDENTVGRSAEKCRDVNGGKVPIPWKGKGIEFFPVTESPGESKRKKGHSVAAPGKERSDLRRARKKKKKATQPVGGGASRRGAATEATTTKEDDKGANARPLKESRKLRLGDYRRSSVAGKKGGGKLAPDIPRAGQAQRDATFATRSDGRS